MIVKTSVGNYLLGFGYETEVVEFGRFKAGQNTSEITITKRIPVVKCYVRFCNDKRTSTLIAEGKSMCHENDVYCKETGRKIALTRALMYITDPEIRKAFWTTYFKRKPDPFNIFFDKFIKERYPNGMPVSLDIGGMKVDIKDAMYEAFNAGRKK